MNKLNKRKQVCLDEIYNAIIRLERKEYTQHEMASELGVSQSTIAHWMHADEKAKFKKTFEGNNLSPARKRLKRAIYEDLNQTLFEWFTEKHRILQINFKNLKFLNFFTMHSRFNAIEQAGF